MYTRPRITLSNTIIGVIAAVLFSLGVVLAGVISGYWQWAVIGGIWTIIFGGVLAVIIKLNIQRNTPPGW
jgi:ABC-type Mn2+/Zn2+ transport system permease subunit